MFIGVPHNKIISGASRREVYMFLGVSPNQKEHIVAAYVPKQPPR